MNSRTKKLAALGVVVILTAGLAYGRVYERVAAWFADGTAAAPSITFISEAGDTGIYRAAANTVGISGNASAAMTITPGTLAMKKTTTANILTSDTTAAVMTSAVPAVRVSPTATPDAEDMLFEVMYGTTSVFSVDKEGDLTFAGSATFSPADLTLSGGDMTSSHTTQTFNQVSQTSAATCTSSIAAITLAPSATLDANDLVLEVNAVSAGTSVLTVDLEGDGVFAGDLALAGNGLTCSGTGAVCLVSSGANDGATSTTAAAIELKSTVNVTDGDLVLRVANSADGTLLKVTEQGAVTALTTVTATTTLVTADNTMSCSFATATCAISSSINDATATSSVAAFTFAPTVDLTAGDLLAEFNDSGGTAQFSLNEQGDGIFTGLVSSVGAETCADSGDGNPGTLTLEADGNVIPLTCSDANGCTITMAETGVANGTLITIINVSANTANFADTAGVTETTGAVALGQYDSLQLVYSVDRWVMVGTSNN